MSIRRARRKSIDDTNANAEATSPVVSTPNESELPTGNTAAAAASSWFSFRTVYPTLLIIGAIVMLVVAIVRYVNHFVRTRVLKVCITLPNVPLAKAVVRVTLVQPRPRNREGCYVELRLFMTTRTVNASTGMTQIHVVPVPHQTKRTLLTQWIDPSLTQPEVARAVTLVWYTNIDGSLWPSTVAPSDRFVSVRVFDHASKRHVRGDLRSMDADVSADFVVPVEQQSCENGGSDTKTVDDWQLMIPRTADTDCKSDDGPSGRFVMSTLPAGPIESETASHHWDTLTPPVGIVVPACAVPTSVDQPTYRFRIEARKRLTQELIASSPWETWSAELYKTTQWIQHTLRLMNNAATIQLDQTVFEDLQIILVLESTAPASSSPTPAVSWTDYRISPCGATVWINHTLPSMTWWAAFAYSLRRTDTRQLQFNCVQKLSPALGQYQMDGIIPPAPVPILLPPHILSTVSDPARVVYLVVKQNGTDTVVALASVGTVTNLLTEQPTSIRMVQFMYQLATPVDVAADPATDDGVTLCDCELIVSKASGYDATDTEHLYDPAIVTFPVEVVLHYVPNSL